MGGCWAGMPCQGPSHPLADSVRQAPVLQRSEDAWGACWPPRGGGAPLLGEHWPPGGFTHPILWGHVAA